jgi:hypothetical protein
MKEFYGKINFEVNMMISVEAITDKIKMLPPSSQKELMDFIDDLLDGSTNGHGKQRASAWEDWAKSHSHNAVIIDDSREIIYEDE